MRFHDEFLDPTNIQKVLHQLKSEVDPKKKYRFMEFCGGHTHTFFNSGLIDLLPENVQMVHGPGCPVCVLPSNRIHSLIKLMEVNPKITAAVFGDVIRVPTENRDSLLKAKARGHDIRSIYSPLEVLQMARDMPEREVIFFAVGFETTTPPTALSLLQAKQEDLSNFSVYCNHVMTKPALTYILENEKNTTLRLDGLIGPGHVSTVLGEDFYEPFVEQYQKPICISGFSPFDLAQSLLLLVKNIKSKKPELINQYSRVVKKAGNPHSKKSISDCFEIRKTFQWRGLGWLPNSALCVSENFKKWDAEAKFDFPICDYKEHPHCICPQVIIGEKSPLDCKLFSKGCTPSSPQGSCMVSSEGACAAYFDAGKGVL